MTNSASCSESAPGTDQGPATRGDDFDPLTDTSTPRQTIVAAARAETGAAAPVGEGSDRLVGTLVHRLIERFGFGADLRDTDVLRVLHALVRPEELVDVVELAGFASRAASAYAAVCARADVRALCAGGERFHEVPFSMSDGGGVLRGTIDCLIRRPDGSLTVLEFKTGRPRPEHRMQLDLYKRAAALIVPGARVEALLVYPHEAVAV
jgi:ATP-dependent exoDNAse (exonuclease V) beta subunit